MLHIPYSGSSSSQHNPTLDVLIGFALSTGEKGCQPGGYLTPYQRARYCSNRSSVQTGTSFVQTSASIDLTTHVPSLRRQEDLHIEQPENCGSASGSQSTGGADSFKSSCPSDDSRSAFEPPLELPQQPLANLDPELMSVSFKRQRAFFDAGHAMNFTFAPSKRQREASPESAFQRFSGSNTIAIPTPRNPRKDAAKREAAKKLTDYLRQCEDHYEKKGREKLPLNTAGSPNRGTLWSNNPRDLGYWRIGGKGGSGKKAEFGTGVKCTRKPDFVSLVQYSCDYCGTQKESTSTGQDGRTRIRCECGGKYADGVARMHAMWSLSVSEEPSDADRDEK